MARHLADSDEAQAAAEEVKAKNGEHEEVVEGLRRRLQETEKEAEPGKVEASGEDEVEKARKRRRVEEAGGDALLEGAGSQAGAAGAASSTPAAEEDQHRELGLCISFTLPRSSYATVFLVRICCCSCCPCCAWCLYNANGP